MQAEKSLSSYQARHNSAQRWLRLLIFGLVSSVLLAQVYTAIMLYRQPVPDEWLLGEWLINYQGGFVRRGLLGEIILQMARWLAISPITLTIIVQTSVFALFLWFTFLLLRHTESSVITFTLLFSPAFLLFPLLAWPHVGVRKEVLFGLILALLLLALRASPRATALLAGLIGAGALIVVLSHEMLVMFLPYLLIAAVCYEQRFGRFSLHLTISFIPAIMVALIIFLMPHASTVTVDAICAALAPRAPRDCAHPTEQLGAITFLAKTTPEGIQFTRSFTTAETTLVYLITGTLSVAPLIATIIGYRLWQLFPGRALAWVSGLWALSLAATVPLFIVAADYGRFINIHVTCSTLLMVWIIQTRQPRLAFPAQFSIRWWLTGILFVTTWRLPMWLLFATFANSFPWLSLLELNK